MRTFKASIEGLTPLLPNRYVEEAELVERIGSKPRDKSKEDEWRRREALLRSIVSIGHSLGLTVTAEGVENAEELACITAAGCDQIQGYFLAKPMDRPDFESWLGQPR